MTDWLTRQAARTLDAISVLQPNLASRFAPVQPGEATAWGEILSTVTPDQTEMSLPQRSASRPPLIQSSSSHTIPLTGVPRLMTRSPLPTVSSTWSDPIPSHESSTLENIESVETSPEHLQSSTEINPLRSTFSPVQLDVVQPLIAPHSIMTPYERSPRLEQKPTASIDSTQKTPPPRQISTSNSITTNSKITNSITKNNNKVQASLPDASDADFLNPISQSQSQLTSDWSIQSSEKSNLTSSKLLLSSEKTEPESSEKTSVRDRFLFNQPLVSRPNSNFNNTVETLTDVVSVLPNNSEKANQTIFSFHQKSDLNTELPLFRDSSSSPTLTPTIQVTIGRIEVRAAPQPQSSKRSSAPQAPALSLKDYLKQRQGG